MKVFSVIVVDAKGRSEHGYIVAESINVVLEIAPGKVNSCSEMGNLICMQGTIEVPQVQDTTRKPRGRWLNISGGKP